MTISIRPNVGKFDLYRIGLRRAYAWLEAHNMRKPSYLFSSIEEANAKFKNFMPKSWYGAQRNDRHGSVIAVNVSKCRVATRIPGWSWSYPGYKTDLTPYGVLCHEIGHHVDRLLGSRGDVSERKAWRDVVAVEEEVSGYEPNHQEAFAEAFRLFLTNPDLLKNGRPERWEYFTEKLQLSPPHEHRWRVVLKHAHPRIISAAESWVNY